MEGPQPLLYSHQDKKNIIIIIIYCISDSKQTNKQTNKEYI